MKILPMLTIIACFFAFSLISNSNVHAMCVYDKDWPQKPCYDQLPGPSNEEKRQEWQRYYEFKGQDWMESKKAEMDMAIKNDTLEKWTEHQSERENFANYNVWYYYYLNDQAPNLVNYYDFRDAPGEVIETNTSPIYLIMVAAIGIGVTLAFVLKRKNVKI